MYVPLSGALMAPLNFTGPVKPDWADGAAQVTDGWLVEDVLTVVVMEKLLLAVVKRVLD